MCLGYHTAAICLPYCSCLSVVCPGCHRSVVCRPLSQMAVSCLLSSLQIPVLSCLITEGWQLSYRHHRYRQLTAFPKIVNVSVSDMSSLLWIRVCLFLSPVSSSWWQMAWNRQCVILWQTAEVCLSFRVVIYRSFVVCHNVSVLSVAVAVYCICVADIMAGCSPFCRQVFCTSAVYLSVLSVFPSLIAVIQLLVSTHYILPKHSAILI